MASPVFPNPLLQPNLPWIDPRTGVPAKEIGLYLLSLDNLVRNALRQGISVVNEAALGVGAGTVTLEPAGGLKQTITNNGAFTIAAPASVGDMQLRVVNGAAAGAITFSGFSKLFTGDALDTTSGHQFVIFVYGWGSKTAYQIKALQ